MVASELVAGTVFAEHLIVERLGSGGMGTVYQARHPRLPRIVALKILDPEMSADQRFRVRFDREAEIVARLDHPNIVDVYDRGIEDGMPWVSMRYVPGGDVAQLIRRHPRGLEPREAIRIVADAAKGLDYAHDRGIVHRDVKPANIFLAEDGRVLIGDFGIARTTDPAATLTVGSSSLTPAYAAPEQLAEGPVDRRIDVYALGITLYELLTGQRPGAGPPAVPLPPELATVVATATTADPADRYPTCGELAEAATAALGRGRRTVFGRRTPRAASSSASRVRGNASSGSRVRRSSWIAVFVVPGLAVAFTAWAALPDTIAPAARPVVAIIPIPGFDNLFCPVPFLRSESGAAAYCTQYDEPNNRGRRGRYYPVARDWKFEGWFTLVDSGDHIASQPDGTLYAGSGTLVHEVTGPIGAGHRYDAAHDNGQFVQLPFGPIQEISALMPVCPTDLSKC